MIDPGIQQQLKSLSTGELAAVAHSPQNYAEHVAVLAELGSRMKAAEAKPPTETVLDQLANQSAPQSSGAPANPIQSGIAAMAQQQQQPVMHAASGGPVRYYAEGSSGGVRPQMGGRFGPRDIEDATPRRRIGDPGVGHADYLSMLRRYQQGLDPMFLDSVSEYAKTPEEAMAIARQFQGEDRLAPFMTELDGQRGQIKEDRRRGRWMNVADAGFRMMGAPTFFSGLGRGGIALTQGLTETDKNYNEANRENMRGRLGIATAQTARDADVGRAASGMYSEGMGARSAAHRGAIEAGTRFIGEERQDARSNAQIAAGQHQILRQFQDLLDAGYSEEEAKAMIETSIMGRAGAGAGAAGSTLDDLTAYAGRYSDREAAGQFDKRHGSGSLGRLEAEMLRRYDIEVNGGIATPTTESPSVGPSRPNTGRTVSPAVAAQIANAQRLNPPPTRSRSGVPINYGGQRPATDSGSSTPGWEVVR